MEILDLIYNDIILRVKCDEKTTRLIKNHFTNYAKINNKNCKNPTYTLNFFNKRQEIDGEHYKMIDKWFNNATLDCYLDNKNRVCHVMNIDADNDTDKNLIIKYFIANVFNQLLNLNGYIGVHSSCVDYNENGVLFVAERFNGKTVCMLNLLNAGFNFVSNDQTAVKKTENSIIGYGVADRISIRLSDKFCSNKNNKKYVDLAMKKGILTIEKEFKEEKKLYLNSVELINMNNVNQTMETNIKYIIRPIYNPYVHETTFEPISKSSLLDLLLSQYKPLVHETTYFLNNISIPNYDNDINKLSTINEMLNIPSYYCHQNEKTTQDFVKKVKKLVRK